MENPRKTFREKYNCDPTNIANVLTYIEWLESLVQNTKFRGIDSKKAYEIIFYTCNEFQVDFIQVIKDTRKNHYVCIRRVLFNVLKDCTSLTFEKIGEIMKRDHSTAVYNIKTKYYIDGDYKEVYENVLEKYAIQHAEKLDQ